jgi:hydroxyquinol 1,2-dioxygenase
MTDTRDPGIPTDHTTPDTTDLADAQLTQAVLDSFAGATTERHGEIMRSLVRHLHAFISEVELTEDEWFAAIDFLTRTGHITTDQRQEWVLLSDVLGVSMLVIGLNNRKPPEATESTVFGPFFVEGSPHVELGGDMARGASGDPCYMAGRILAVDGTPIPHARIEVWQSDDDGFYDVQYDDLDHPQGRGHLFSDDEGRWSFWSVRPVAYPIPDDGPVGDLLVAAGRGPMRPAHVHFMVTADGYQRLITHVFDGTDEHLGTDAVFGVRRKLIGTFDRHEAATTAPDGTTPDTAWYELTYDLVLAPAAEEA